VKEDPSTKTYINIPLIDSYLLGTTLAYEPSVSSTFIYNKICLAI